MKYYMRGKEVTEAEVIEYVKQNLLCELLDEEPDFCAEYIDELINGNGFTISLHDEVIIEAERG